MKKAFLTILFCGAIATSVFAQNLNNYKFVRVPAEFDFQKGENQYQLNALTAFLFEKYGFEAIYKEKLPSGVEGCDILSADVQSESDLFRTRLYVVLKDCNDNILYTSGTGGSRKKDYKAAYHEALREAFSSYEELDYEYSGGASEIIIDPVVSSEEIAEVEENSVTRSDEIVIDPVITSEDIQKLQKDPIEGKGFRTYTNSNTNYQLRKNTSGFELFKEDGGKFATLVKSGGGDNYIYSGQGVQGSAFFDEKNNLIVEYLDPPLLVTVKYELQD